LNRHRGIPLTGGEAGWRQEGLELARRMIDHNVRDEQTTVTAWILIKEARALREAKTARLREQRLAVEAALSNPAGDDLKRTPAAKRSHVR
jgi:hypothetical protein